MAVRCGAVGRLPNRWMNPLICTSAPKNYGPQLKCKVEQQYTVYMWAVLLVVYWVFGQNRVRLAWVGPGTPGPGTWCLATILIAFFTAHKYMPKTLQWKYSAIRKCGNNNNYSLRSGQQRENCGKIWKRFQWKLMGKRCKILGCALRMLKNVKIVTTASHKSSSGSSLRYPAPFKHHLMPQMHREKHSMRYMNTLDPLKRIIK